MKHFALALGILAALSGPVIAQSGNSPAELPPEGFDGREFTDSQGCIFLRSTFGGEVTWIPRVGPDRRPVCDGTPSFDAGTRAVPQAVVPAPVIAAPEAPEPVAEPPVAEAPVAPRAQPQPQARREPPARPRPAQSDASGRHRDCPPNAPFGQLVRTAEGRMLVRCVTSPSLFID